MVDDSSDVAVAGGGGPASPQERKPKARRPSYVNLAHDGEEDGLLGGADDEDRMVDAVLDVFPGKRPTILRRAPTKAHLPETWLS